MLFTFLLTGLFLICGVHCGVRANTLNREDEQTSDDQGNSRHALTFHLQHE